MSIYHKKVGCSGAESDCKRKSVSSISTNTTNYHTMTQKSYCAWGSECPNTRLPLPTSGICKKKKQHQESRPNKRQNK